jgi:hypothetical protein
MPGKEVKDWKVYEALRKEGHSKESAARIANSQASKGGKKK